jgi:DNA polymerase III alpha subunit
VLDLLSRVEMSPTEAASLIKVGACDDLSSAPTVETDASLDLPPLNRAQMLWLLPTLISIRKPKRQQTQNSTLITHNSLAPIQLALGDFVHDMGAPRILGSSTLRIDVPDIKDFSLAEKLRLEQEVLGFSLTRNEMDLYAGAVASLGVVPSHDLTEHAGRKVTVAGVIAAGRRHLAKAGEWMLFISLQDSGGLMEVVLFPEAYKEHGALLANNGYGPYLVTGMVQVAGKGRGIGVQLPAGLRPSDAVVLKTHPVVIAEKMEPLEYARELRSA